MFMRILPCLILACIAVLAMGASETCMETEEKAASPPTAAAAEEPDAEEEEERRKGFHCLSEWDGNHEGLEVLIQDRLNDPGSMETIETRIAVADAQGDHRIQLDFTAKNTLGGRDRYTAHGWVSQATCEATLTLVE